MSRPRRWTACTAMIALVGCSDAEERPRYVTEHLVVELYDGEVLCAGTLASMDAQVERVAAFLGIGPPEAIPVHYGASAVTENCGSLFGGCARASGVYATDVSIFHELVHAVRQSQGEGGSVGSWLFEEGLAEVLSGFRWHREFAPAEVNATERGPAVLADLPRGEGKFIQEDYAVASHFMSWLRTTYGDEALVPFLNDPRYLGREAYHEAFVEHFGLTIAEADAMWRGATPMDYVWAEACDPAAMLAWEGSVLEFADTVDCEDPSTVGPDPYGYFTLRSHCFALQRAATVRVEFITDGGRLRLSPVDCVDTDELPPAYYEAKSLRGGDVRELPFAACAWEVQVDGGPKSPRDFRLRLTQL